MSLGIDKGSQEKEKGEHGKYSVDPKTDLQHFEPSVLSFCFIFKDLPKTTSKFINVSSV